MPIAISCNECRTAYRVPDETAGKAMKCKKCGKLVAIPNGKAPSASGARKPDKPKKGGGKVFLFVGGGLLGVLALCCCIPTGLGSWWAFFRPAPKVEINDLTKDLAAEFGKAEFAKDLTKEPPKDGGKDPGKDPFKDLAKNLEKEFGKDAFKDFGKDLTKAFGKDAVKNPPTGKEILSQQAFLSPKDPQLQGKPCKTFPVNLEQGKTYVIDMQSKEIDSYLRLHDPANTQVAYDDDSGGGLNARITYTAKQSGAHQIHATVLFGLPPNGGNFTLSVRQQ